MNTPVTFPIAKLLKEKDYKIEDCFNAPIIAEVVMWLYEKHGIWIWAGVRENDDKQLVFIPNGRNIPIKKDKNGNTIDCIQYSVHKTPTEAYETAIEYTLNNLI